MNARRSWAVARVGSWTARSLLFKVVFAGTVLLASPVVAVDTDGDGLLDLLDVPGFDPTTRHAVFDGLGVQDLDGADLLTNAVWFLLRDNQITRIDAGDFQGLYNVIWLFLERSQIASIEPGAFQGLDRLEGLELAGNQLTSIEPGVFEGLHNLRVLSLNGNLLTELDFSRVGFQKLTACQEFASGFYGFCASGNEITRLRLDDASLSRESFESIVGETPAITEASLIGLSFADNRPISLDQLLGIGPLAKVTVEPEFFSWYLSEFLAFNAIDGKSVDVLWPAGTLPTGDFDLDGQLTLSDFDVLMEAAVSNPDDPTFDLNYDGTVNFFDRAIWIRLLKGTYFGDANFDGEFNSADFTYVFEAGEYEDAIEDNSGWAEGDWDGDGDFTSADFITAFLDGGYEQGPRAEVVPEPSGVLFTVLALLTLAMTRRNLNTHDCV